MWRSLQHAPNSLLLEILLRVILAGVVCLFDMKVSPRTWHLTEAELVYYSHPRQHSYVPTWMLLTIVFIIPLSAFIIAFLKSKNYVDIVQSFLSWTLALCLNAVVTEAIKLIVGRPRPDFFYRCFPDGIMSLDRICTSKQRAVIEGRKSFPSGHTSYSFCSFGFLSLWLCGKLGVFSTNRGECASVVICLLPLCIASVVSGSRYMDNHHHWEDILAGAVLGLVTAYMGYSKYYYPLVSEAAGEPYSCVLPHQLYDQPRGSQCRTSRDLDDDLYLMIALQNREPYRDNKKVR